MKNTKEQNELLKTINKHYEQLLNCNTTSGRKYNYDKIIENYNKDISLCSQYWMIDETQREYIYKINPLKNFVDEKEVDCKESELKELAEWEEFVEKASSAKITKEKAIELNMFLYCLKKFQNSSAVRWVNYWFDACVTIFKKSKDYAKFFIIDIENHIIHKIGDLIKKIKPKKEGESHTYLIKMFDIYHNWVYTKIGKANNLNNRMNQLKKEFYKAENCQIGGVEIIKEYALPNDDLAQVLESLMRNYFRKTKEFIPNDRFAPFEPTTEDLEIFEKNYNLVLTNA